MASENLTPTRFSAAKQISGTKDGRDYSFQSIGFQTREYGDRWFNLAFNKENPLKEGVSIELEIKQRPYKDKEGNEKIAYDAKKPNPLVDFAKTIMALSVRVGKLEEQMKLVVHTKPTPAELPEPPDDFNEVNGELAGLEHGEPAY